MPDINKGHIGNKDYGSMDRNEREDLSETSTSEKGFAKEKELGSDVGKKNVGGADIKR